MLTIIIPTFNSTTEINLLRGPNSVLDAMYSYWIAGPPVVSEETEQGMDGGMGVRMNGGMQ